MYQPRGNNNRNILKHIFQSPMDLVKLQNVVGPNVRFQPFPNPVDPEGIKFTNSVSFVLCLLAIVSSWV